MSNKEEERKSPLGHIYSHCIATYLQAICEPKKSAIINAGDPVYVRSWWKRHMPPMPKNVIIRSYA